MEQLVLRAGRQQRKPLIESSICTLTTIPEVFFKLLRDTPSDFSFDKDPTGRTIITHHGARFFGVTPPMSDPQKRLEDMDRVGIDVEVISLSLPTSFSRTKRNNPKSPESSTTLTQN
jgi:hypothetical protein